MRWKWVVLAPLAVVGFVLFIFLGGEIVRLLWNWLLPPLFGWPQITFWQALGLLVLCRILFGGVGGHGRGHSDVRRRVRRRVHRRMSERWDRMTPDERERFRHGVRARRGEGPSASEDTGSGA